ncbi:hypothetical protein KO481_20165 [Nocardia sp. NEAU-G5]|uniref:Farnesoic acid O-methyl transferase domain-containing protein n=1 Tax=Nocardia albiluteola TaxID=2842303 RepID=A0ABS6B312_9NOCA|nr:hypothetical protein [Nocardia albiluteola]MBU3063836.1 hypothetical protein [Nocardia albiluteola]
MSIIDGRSVILVTFAGRRDRMELLSHYAAEALRRNLVDEWHVWNFARHEDDDRWLNSRFPALGRTPDNLAYYPAGSIDTESETGCHWDAQVRAGHDVHIGIRARGANYSSYELVLGGWENKHTALLYVETSELLVEHAGDRPGEHGSLVDVCTPGILAATTFRDVRLSLASSTLTLSVDGAIVIQRVLDIRPGSYDIFVKTGYGADGEWRLPGLPDTGEYLYHGAERWRAGFAEAIGFYAARGEHYRDAVFLKCDDDVPYLQLDKLEDFIRFRLARPEYFLVSANVVNHNVCAYYQQQHGAIPRSLMELELPPGGFGGSLWESPERARALHHHFLDNRELFEQVSLEPVEWSGRLAMHFVAWMGADLSYMSADMVDEERALSVQIPTYLGRWHCLYPGFVVAHLSSGMQAGGMNDRQILGRYRRLASRAGLTAGESLAPESAPNEDFTPLPVRGCPGRTFDTAATGTREPGDEPNIAIIVLNFNTAEMTDKLADYLNNTLEYSRKRVYVIDNGSSTTPGSATHVLPDNRGFTRGMYAGFQIASEQDDYDAFWLLNSDVSFDYGDTVLRVLATVLFSSEAYAQISPQHNSWLPDMEHAEDVASVRGILEPTATLIKRSTIERLGFWDLDMPLGYGTDHDYGYRIRSAGLLSILTSQARIHHMQHQSMDDFDDYDRRGHAEENAVLSRKYGDDWQRLFSEY